MAASSAHVAAFLQHGAEHTGTGSHVTADHHVLQRRHVAEQADILESPGNAALGRLMRRIGEQRSASKGEAAAIRHIQARHAVEEGGFAGAIGPIRP
jgi:hypothetical protein